MTESSESNQKPCHCMQLDSIFLLGSVLKPKECLAGELEDVNIIKNSLMVVK